MIYKNWGVDPLSAIPDVDDLRPACDKAGSCDFVRYLSYLSDRETNIEVARSLMVHARDRRLKDAKTDKGKEKWLKVVDLRNIVYNHKDSSGVLSGKQDPPAHRARTLQQSPGETSDSQLPNGTGVQRDDAVPSGPGFRPYSCSPGAYVLHRHRPHRPTIPNINIKRQRPEDLPDGQPLLKRPRYNKVANTNRDLLDISGSRNSLEYIAHTSALCTTSSEAISHSTTFTKKPFEGPDQGEKLANANVVAGEVALENTKRPTESAPQVYPKTGSHHTARIPTVSSSSDTRTHLRRTSSPETASHTFSSPVTRMLGKITTDFTDSLFLLHAVVRIYAKTDTARSYAQALDAAADDVLESVKTFGSRVERIIKGNIELCHTHDQRVSPAGSKRLQDGPDVHRENEGEQAATTTESTVVDVEITDQIDRSSLHSSRSSVSPTKEHIETSMLESLPKAHPESTTRQQGDEMGVLNPFPQLPTSFPRGHLDPAQELLRNPWSSELSLHVPYQRATLREMQVNGSRTSRAPDCKSE